MKKTILGAMAAFVVLALTPALPATAQSSGSLSNPDSAFEDNSRRASWHAEVERTERGFRIGDPDAEAALIEFISYTCTHCATFAREGEGALDIALLSPGHMSLEVRPVIRNGIDLAVSLLVQCGGADGFKDRHRMFLARQDTWMARARSAPQAQQEIWARGTAEARLNAARALDLDDMLAARGTSMADINACLADNQAALALIRNGDADREEFKIPGTPSFALDGELLTDVHDWAALYPVLAERFRPSR